MLAFSYVCCCLSLLSRCLQDTAPVEEVWKTFPVRYASVEMSEDCLYLNVYKPTETASGDRLPVSAGARMHNDSAN